MTILSSSALNYIAAIKTRDLAVPCFVSGQKFLKTFELSQLGKRLFRSVILFPAIVPMRHLIFRLNPARRSGRNTCAGFLPGRRAPAEVVEKGVDYRHDDQGEEGGKGQVW